MGWAFSSKSDADLIIKALNMAHELHGRPQDVLFHSDQGSQYGSRNFRQRLWRYRFKQSMSRRGNCHDNAQWSDFSQLGDGMGTYLHQSMEPPLILQSGKRAHTD